MNALVYFNTFFFPIFEWLIFAYTLHKVLSQGKLKPAVAALTFVLIAGITVISSDLELHSRILHQAFLVLSATILTRIIYKAPLHIAAFFSFAVYYISVLSDLLVGNTTMAFISGDIESMMATNPPVRLIFNLASKLVQILFSYLLIKGFRRISWTIPVIYWAVMDIVIFCYLTLAVAFGVVNPYLQTQVAPGLVALMVMLFILVNFLTFALFTTISTHYINSQLEYVTRVTKARLDNDLLEFENEKTVIRKTNHDFKNTLSNIALLVQDDAKTEALDYIADYSSALPEISIAQYTGIAGVDSIISLKTAVTQGRNIHICIEAEPLPTQGISIIDIATILSNMLDNAIEANLDIPLGHREIRLQCYMVGDMLNIVVSNPYRRAPLKVNNRLISSKSDLDAHGYGTIIVREICERHSGSFLVEYADGVFKAHATMLATPANKPLQ